jgi:LuxR family maltose regulon positive regulatory protein
MSGSFRLVPPEPRTDLVPRPRLMRSLLGRWEHRVTSLTGGPGLGKTTVLAQALAENRLAPRGEDRWVGVEAQDADASRLARIVAAAVEGHSDSHAHPLGRRPGRDEATPEPMAVADAVWHLAPTEACLVLDDVHLLPAGSTGALWLADFVGALPANGHVVFASRSEPPVALTRYGAQGAVLHLAEEDLRFTHDELSSFAAQRGFEPGWFDDTGGWPAMAELAASVDKRFTGKYLWEEVLEPLGTLRRHVLAVLCDLSGADDGLVSAAVGTPVELASVLEEIPLVARGADGWYVPHGLWRTAPGIALPPLERAEVRRRAVHHLTGRGRFDQAFSLLQEAELWDAAPELLREACLASDRLLPSQLGRWLARSSDAVRASPAGRLATGLHTALTVPALAVEPLEEARARSRADGDLDAELAAIAQLGQIAWWRQDDDALGEIITRLFELEPTGHPVARALAAIARAAFHDLAGDDAAVLAELDSMATGVLDTVWDAYAGWMCGAVHLDTGTPEATDEIIERLRPSMDSVTRPIIESLQFRAWWAAGQVDKALARIPVVVADEQRTGPTYNHHLGQIFASIAFSYAGDVETARRYLDDSSATAPPSADLETDARSVLIAAATASLQLAEGDEPAAAATLRAAVEVHGVDRGVERRTWRQTLALSYVLVPDARAYWDQASLHGYQRRARDLAAALVAVRHGAGANDLRALDLPSTGAIRSALHHRHAAELAVEAAAAGRAEGRALLDALGPAGRSAVRALAAARTRQATRARSLLAAVPAPPPRTTHLAVLGPLEMRRDGPHGEEVVEAGLRRQRLQALLAFLIGHRRTTRGAIIAALWPDLDDQAALNNLGVTLNHLLRLLEPWRNSGEPSYLVRPEGQTVQLVTGTYLALDIDQFDHHQAAAARAEADGAPSVALEHDRAAVALYRGDLYADLTDTGWFTLDREHYRSRFVTTAVRAGQLLLGRGDIDDAEAVAQRALAVDPWAEPAYAVLVGTALARDDRSTARRLLHHCASALAELGSRPSTATQQLQRRVLGANGDP